MRTLITLGILALSAVSGNAMAGDNCDGPNCKPKTKEVCFNLACYYNNWEAPTGYQTCKAVATFTKDVTKDGGEVRDDSEKDNHPSFQVTCDDTSIFNNGAHRYTDLLGTRIQAQTGPFPAILLPRGALHSGSDHTSGDHVSASVLELDIGPKLLRTEGICHIWTGNP